MPDTPLFQPPVIDMPKIQEELDYTPPSYTPRTDSTPYTPPPIFQDPFENRAAGEGTTTGKSVQEIENLIDSARVDPNKPKMGGGKYLTVGEAKNDRYPDYHPGYDNEDIYGMNQGAWNKIWHGTVKGVGIAATTFINGTAGLIYGTGAAIGNKSWSSFYNNDFTKGLDEFSKEMEKTLPNYYTAKETNAEWWSPDNIFTANFLADKLIKNAGFAVGAMAAGGAWGAALKGIGLTARFAANLDKIKSAQLAALEAEMYAAPAAEQAGIWLKGMKAINQNLKYNVNNVAQRAIVAGMGTFGEAGMEAMGHMNEFRDAQIEAYKQAHGGVGPGGKELADIEDYAKNLGNTAFAANVALLSFTNYIQFPKVIGSTIKGETNLLNRATNRIIQNAEGKWMKQVASTSENKLLRGLYQGARRLEQGKNIAGLVLSPSEAFEEGMQSAIQFGVKNYYDKGYRKYKLNEEGVEEPSIWEDMIGHGFDQALHTKEGKESMLLGGLTGGLMEARHTVRERGFTGAGGQIGANTKAAVAALNNTKKLNEYLKVEIANKRRAENIQQARVNAIRQGDVLESKDLEFDYANNFLQSRIKWGKYDSVETEVAQMRERASTDEGWEQLKAEGVVTETDTQDAFNKRLDNLLVQAKTMKESYESLGDLFGRMYNKDGTRKYGEHHIDMMVYSAAKIQDYQDRIRQLSVEQKGINILQLNTLLDSAIQWAKAPNTVREKEMYDSLNKAYDEIEAQNIPEVEKDKQKEKVRDAMELAARRQTIINEYDDIKKNPQNYKSNLDYPQVEPQEMAFVTEDTSGLTPEELEEYNKAKEEAAKKGETFELRGREWKTYREYQHKGKGYKARKNSEGDWEVVDSEGDVVDTFTDRGRGAEPGSPTAEERAKAVVDSTTGNVTVLGRSENNLKIRDEKGRTHIVSPAFLKDHEIIQTEEEVFEENPSIQEEMAEVSVEMDKESSDVETGDPEIDLEMVIEGGTQKPPPTAIATGSVAPMVTEKDVTHNRAQREQLLLETLVHDDKLRGSIRVIPITVNSQDAHGFKDFLPPTYNSSNGKVIDNAKDTDEGMIALIYVVKDESGNWWTLKQDGTRHQMITKDNLQDPNEFVYTFQEPATLTRNGVRKYYTTNRQGEEIWSDEEVDKILKHAKEDRAKRYKNNDALGQATAFKVSRGFPNSKRDGTRNSVVDAGLMAQEDLGKKDIIIIPTVEDPEDPSKGLLPAVDGESGSAPMGRPMLARGTDVHFLHNMQINSELAENIFNALRHIAQTVYGNEGKRRKKVPAETRQAISNLIYTGKKGKMYIDKNGKMTLNKKTFILSPQRLESDRDEIMAELAKLYLNVNNKTLGEKKAFDEFIGLKDGKPIYRKWKSYQEFLLSPVYSLDPVYDENNENGQPRSFVPLTTTIDKPTTYDSGVPTTPNVGKYINLTNYSSYNPTAKKTKAPASGREKTGKNGKPTAAPKPATQPYYVLENNEVFPAKLRLDGKTLNTLRFKNGSVVGFTARVSDDEIFLNFTNDLNLQGKHTESNITEIVSDIIDDAIVSTEERIARRKAEGVQPKKKQKGTKGKPSRFEDIEEEAWGSTEEDLGAPEEGEMGEDVVAEAKTFKGTININGREVDMTISDNGEDPITLTVGGESVTVELEEDDAGEIIGGTIISGGIKSLPKNKLIEQIVKIYKEGGLEEVAPLPTEEEALEAFGYQPGMSAQKKKILNSIDTENYYYLIHQTDELGAANIMKNGFNMGAGLTGTTNLANRETIANVMQVLDEGHEGPRRHMLHKGSTRLIIMKFPKTDVPGEKLSPDDISHAIMDKNIAAQEKGEFKGNPTVLDPSYMTVYTREEAATEEKPVKPFAPFGKIEVGDKQIMVENTDGENVMAYFVTVKNHPNLKGIVREERGAWAYYANGKKLGEGATQEAAVQDGIDMLNKLIDEGKVDEVKAFGAEPSYAAKAANAPILPIGGYIVNTEKKQVETSKGKKPGYTVALENHPGIKMVVYNDGKEWVVEAGGQRWTSKQLKQKFRDNTVEAAVAELKKMDDAAIKKMGGSTTSKKSAGSKVEKLNAQRDRKLAAAEKKNAEELAELDPDNPATKGSEYKVGEEVTEDMNMIVRGMRGDSNYTGDGTDGVLFISRVMAPAKYDKNGKLVRRAVVQVTRSNDKKDAMKFIAKQMAIKRSYNEKNLKRIEDEYAAELSDVGQDTGVADGGFAPLVEPTVKRKDSAYNIPGLGSRKGRRVIFPGHPNLTLVVIEDSTGFVVVSTKTGDTMSAHQDSRDEAVGAAMNRLNESIKNNKQGKFLKSIGVGIARPTFNRFKVVTTEKVNAKDSNNKSVDSKGEEIVLRGRKVALIGHPEFKGVMVNKGEGKWIFYDVSTGTALSGATPLRYNEALNAGKEKINEWIVTGEKEALLKKMGLTTLNRQESRSQLTQYVRVGKAIFTSYKQTYKDVPGLGEVRGHAFTLPDHPKWRGVIVKKDNGKFAVVSIRTGVEYGGERLLMRDFKKTLPEDLNRRIEEGIDTETLAKEGLTKKGGTPIETGPEVATKRKSKGQDAVEENWEMSEEEESTIMEEEASSRPRSNESGDDLDSLIKEFGGTKEGDENLPEFDDDDPPFRMMLTDEEVDEVWNKETFVAWMKENLPHVNIVSLKQPLKTSGGGWAWGAQRGNYVYIYENAPSGTEWHEAAEVVWNSFLTEREQKELVKEFNSREGNFFDRTTSKLVNYSDASPSQAKEQIMEEFIDFKEDRPIPQPKQLNFFQRLWKFITEFVFGNPLTINEMFVRMDSGQYKNAVSVGDSKHISYRLITGNPTLGQQWANDVMMQMSEMMFDELQKDGKSLQMLADGEVKLSDVYTTVYNKMDQFYRRVANSKLSGDTKLYLLRGWKFISDKANWPLVVAEHTMFLRPLNIEYKKSEDQLKAYAELLNEKEELSEAEIDKRRKGMNKLFDKDPLDYDSFGSASKGVRMVYSMAHEATFDEAFNPSLADPKYKRNSVFAKVLVNGPEEFYRTQNALLGSRDMADMKERMYNLATVVPNQVALYNMFMKMAPSMMTKEQWTQKVQFFNAMHKQSPLAVVQTIDETGDIYQFEMTKKEEGGQILADWRAVLTTTDIVDIVKNVPQINTKKIGPPVKTEEDMFAFFKRLSFPLTKEMYAKMNKEGKRSALTEATALHAMMLKIGKRPGNNGYVSANRGAELNARFETLAKLIIGAVGDGSGSYFGPENAKYSKNVLHNYFSLVLNHINSAVDEKDLREKRPVFKDIWCKNSVLLKDWNMERTHLSNSVMFGQQGEHPFVEMSKMGILQRKMTEINANLRNSHGSRPTYFTLVGADTKREWAIASRHYVSMDEWRNDPWPRIKYIFNGYLEDEINLIIDEANPDTPSRSSHGQLGKDSGNGRTNAQRLRFFKDILDADFVEEIEEIFNDPTNTITPQAYIRANSERIRQGVEKFINGKASKTIKMLEDKGAIHEHNGRYTWDGIDVNVLDSWELENGDLTAGEIQGLIRFRTYNYVIHNIETYKLFFGDPAQRKDPDKRTRSYLSGRLPMYINDADFNRLMNGMFNKTKRGTKIKDGDIGFVNFEEEFTGMTYNHGEDEESVISANYDDYYKAYFDDAKKRDLSDKDAHDFADKNTRGYKAVDDNNAQSYRASWSVMQELMRTTGTTKEQDEYFAWDSACARYYFSQKEDPKNPGKMMFDYEGRDDLREEDRRQSEKKAPSRPRFWVSKPIGSGVLNRNGRMETHLLKTSTMPLFFSMVRGRALEDMYLFMWKNKIDYIGPMSQHKEGVAKVLPNLYDRSTGKVNFEGLTAAVATDATYRFPWEYFGRQVETAEESTKTPRLTQLTALYRGDMLNQGVPIDAGKISAGKWNKLSENAKRATSKIYRLGKDNEEALKALTKHGYDKVLNRLGIGVVGGQHVFTDIDKTVNYLRMEMSRRDLDNNTIQAIQDLFNPNTSLSGSDEMQPIETLTQYTAIKRLIWSLVNREVVHPYMNGGGQIQVSSTMWETNKRSAMYLPDSKDPHVKWKKVTDYDSLSETEKASVKLTSDQLKFYTLEKGDKQIRVMEVFLPNFLRKQLQQYEKYKEMSDEEILSELNSTEEGQTVLRGIGVRIPTQGANSIEVFRVKGFTSPGLGNAIVVPAELTTKSGSDFDVDKLYTYLRNVVVKDGRITLIPYFQSKEEAFVWLKKSNVKVLSDDEIDEEGDVLDLTEEEVYLFGLTEREERVAEEIYKKGLENEYYRTLEEMIRLPQNYLRLLSPNRVDESQDIEKEITETKGGKSTRNKKDINYSDQLDPEIMAENRALYLEMKDKVAVGASNLKLFVVLQSGDVRMKGRVKMPHNAVIEEEENDKGTTVRVNYMSLSRSKNVNGEYISDINSQTVNGAVDTVKDPWLARLLGDANALNVMQFLDGIGVPMEYSRWFLQQPAIQRYLELTRTSKDLEYLDPSTPPLTRGEILELIQDEFGWTKNDRHPDDVYDIDDLKESVANYHRYITEGEELDDETIIMQKDALQQYLEYTRYADSLFSLNQSLSWDTAYYSSSSSVNIKVAESNHVTDLPIKGRETITDGTYIGYIIDMIGRAQAALTPIFRLTGPTANVLLKPIIDFYAKPSFRMTDDRKSAVMEAAEICLMEYLVLNFAEEIVDGQKTGKNIGQFLLEYLVNDKNIASELMRIKGLAKGDLAQNMALKQLRPVNTKSITGVKNVGMPRTPTDSFARNIVTEGLRELRDNELTKDFYQMLIISGLLQQGFTHTRTAFNSLIPNEDFIKYSGQAVAALAEKDFSTQLKPFIDLNVLQRSYWHNTDIVPVVKKEINRRGNKVVPYTDNGALIRIQGDTQFLAISPENPAAKFPIVKVMETAINPITKVKYTSREKKQMRKNGDYSFEAVKLFKLVPGITVPGPSTKDSFKTEAKFVYKQINAWGNGREAKEMYTDARQSVLPFNFKVTEIDDDLIVNTVEGYKTAMRPIVVATPSGDIVVNKSRGWQGDLDERDVFTAEGINTMRTKGRAGEERHFGNPLSYTNFPGTVQIVTQGTEREQIEAASRAYGEWLRGTNYLDVNVEQRTWVLNQIHNPKSELRELLRKGLPLLYMNKMVAREKYYSHAEELAKYISEVIPGAEPAATAVKQYESEVVPGENVIFVFGSNTTGNHGAGAAKQAKADFGAIQGRSKGLQGNSYGIVTKDMSAEDGGRRSIDPEEITAGIQKMYEDARTLSDKKFMVAHYPLKKVSLNGYTGEEMLEMFLNAGPVPDNVFFHKEWVNTGKLKTATSNMPTEFAPISVSEAKMGEDVYTRSGDVYRRWTYKGKNADGSPKLADDSGKLSQLGKVKLYVDVETFDGPLKEYVNHSGGAEGADSIWDDEGREYSMVKNRHYWTGTRPTPRGNKKISKEDHDEGAVEAAQAAQMNYGYQYKTMKNGLLIRNWAQVKHSDAVFAVATLVNPGEPLFPDEDGDNRKANMPTATGGTGYAVGMAINNGKPVYLFNQNKGSYDIGWYTWTGKDWTPIPTPTLTKNFAGIGSRNINDAGKQAIKDVYKKTAGEVKAGKLRPDRHGVFEGVPAPTVGQYTQFNVRDQEGKLTPVEARPMTFDGHPNLHLFVYQPKKGTRWVVADGHGRPFMYFKSLTEAKEEIADRLNDAAGFVANHEHLEEIGMAKAGQIQEERGGDSSTFIRTKSQEEGQYQRYLFLSDEYTTDENDTPYFINSANGYQWVEGRQIIIDGHPDLALYVRLDENENWVVDNIGVGESLPVLSTTDRGSMDEVVMDAIEYVNEEVRTGQNNRLSSYQLTSLIDPIAEDMSLDDYTEGLEKKCN